MQSTRWIVLFVMSLLVMSVGFGCGETEEADDDDTLEAPDPVAPLEVATPDEDVTAEGTDPPTEPVAEGDEAPTGPSTAEAEVPETMESLRARVAELEGQLASCQGGTTPEGVEVPGGEDTSETTAGTTQARRRGNGDTTRTNRGLLGTLLGPDEPANGRQNQQGEGTNDPRPVELPDPTRILFGQ